ncbi:MAG: hypothetical protein IKQ49_02195 [Eubacterium sp.]|nr:hypothetical protein [Eubacterium sp.]
MPYELKPSDEIQNKEKQLAEDKEKYGDKDWNPEQGLPAIVDHGAVRTGKVKAASSKSSIVFKVIGVLLLLGVAFGAVKLVQHILGSGGEDISQYLGLSEAEIADKLDISFEQHNELSKYIQQYSGGTVTVREGDGLQTVYIDGKQVGVCTDSHDYRFWGVGINDADKDVASLITFKNDGSFVVLNDLMGGSSTSYYYTNYADNTVFVITINGNTNRVVFLSYFTDLNLVTKNLSF